MLSGNTSGVKEMKKNCRPENETSKNGKNSCKNSYEVHNLVKCVAFSSWNYDKCARSVVFIFAISWLWPE